MKDFAEQKDSTTQIQSRSWWAKGTRFVLFILLGLSVLSVIVSVLLSIPSVQQKLIVQTEKYITDKTGMETQIGRFRMQWFRTIVLDDVLIVDKTADTLLVAGHLKTSLTPHWGGLTVSSLSLTDARIHTVTDLNQKETNLAAFLAALFPGNKKKKSNRDPFDIRIGYVELLRCEYINEHKPYGKYQRFALDKAVFRFKFFDFPAKKLVAKSIILTNPDVDIRDTVPGDSSAWLAFLASSAPVKKDTTKWNIYVDDLDLVQGRFRVSNDRRPLKNPIPANVIDYTHMDYSDINIRMECFQYKDPWSFQVVMEHLSCREKSGFVLKKGKAAQLIATPQGASLLDVQLETENSVLGDTLVFVYDSYRDWQTFVDDVGIEANFKTSQVAIRDILYFAGGLKSNPFFSRNQEKVVTLSGRSRGTVNNLRGNDVSITIPNQLYLNGNFGFRDLTYPGSQYLYVKLEDMETTMKTIKQIIPGYNLPPTFDELGRLKFKGVFDGFFDNFVAYGTVRTDLGQASVDIQMSELNTIPAYTGSFSLTNFELGKWTGNTDLGTVSVRDGVIKGRGVTSATASAELKAVVEHIDFLKYRYKNASVNGKLNKNLFDGVLSIQDDNIDLNFNGNLNFDENNPSYDFVAQVKKLALKPLYLAKEDIVLQGDVDLNLKNRKISDLIGQALIRNVVVSKGSQKHTIDSFFIVSVHDSIRGEKRLDIRSDVLSGTINGQYDIDKIHLDFLRYLQKYYPGFARRAGVRLRGTTNSKADSLRQTRFAYSFKVHDTQGLQKLAGDNIPDFKDWRIFGFFDNVTEKMEYNLTTSCLEVNRNQISGLVLRGENQKGIGRVNFGVDHMQLGNLEVPDPVLGEMDFMGDTILFRFEVEGAGVFIRDGLAGRFTLVDSTGYEVVLEQQNLILAEVPWLITQDNYIRFWPKKWEANGLTLTNGNKKVRIQDVSSRGISMSLENLDLSIIDDYWDYKPLDFSGVFNAQLEIEDIYTLKGINAGVSAPRFLVNEDDWGEMTLRVNGNDFNGRLNGEMRIQNRDTILFAKGYYQLKDEVAIPTTAQKAAYFSMGIDINQYPVRYAEYFLAPGIKNTVGTFDAHLDIAGPSTDMQISGLGTIYQGATTIDYLKTRYYIQEGNFKVTNSLFDATGMVITDRLGNKALIEGGISHDHLKNLGLNASISTERFLGLDTRKGDNPLFYGQAIGSGRVAFTGNFQQPNIYIDASVGDSSLLVIPVSAARDTTSLKVIRFVDKSKEAQEQEDGVTKGNLNTVPPALRGVSIEMDLSIQRGAEMQLIFDEQAGDIIKGKGVGDLRILLPRGGSSFSMYGNYLIESGQYLFTYYRFINKAFTVRRGGEIIWNGDPFGAQIQLTAEYKGVNTSLTSFIEEYLVTTSTETRQAASKSVPVELVMYLQGPLIQPVINFDVIFPSLPQELRNYTDNKLRLIRQDPNELNRQVFGLMVLGQFLPTDFALQTGTLDLISNTVGEFISNQLSLLLTGLFSEFLEDGKVFSGTDFNIAYDPYDTDVQAQDFTQGDNLAFQLKQSLFNDRLEVLVGGNIDFGGSLRTSNQAGAFIGNDVSVEYLWSKDGTLRLRFYHTLEPDFLSTRRREIGTGITFNREFDNFSDFWKDLKSGGRKNRK